MSRFAYTVMFVDDDGYMQHTIPQTYRASRKKAAEVVWAAVDEQRRYHAQQCSGVAA